MQLSIIIPTKDRGKVFDQALQSVLAAIDGLDAEVIVINDSKSSRPIIPPKFHNVKLMDNPKSGVASARNFGASLSQAELMLFMDDDFVIPPHSITRVIKIAERDSKKIHLFSWIYPPTLQQRLTGLQFGRYLIQHGFTSVQGWLGDEWRDEEVFELKDGASYFLPIRKSVFAAIGGYNEDFPHAGAEDYDFVQRAKETGIRFYLDKSCVLYHNEEDRIDLKNWLQRKKRNGETIKLAFQLGHQTMSINYSPYKRFILKMLSHIKFLFFVFLNVIPNISFFDRIYFGFTNTLLAIYIYEGYTENDKVK